MVTSQIYKESKKRATYSIHHLWKQDLSANNSLPNFADDLNGNKSPRVILQLLMIADNFYSFNNDFLKLKIPEQLFISKSFNSDSISISSFNKSIPQNFTVSSSKVKRK